MDNNPLYHVRLTSADLRLKCCVQNCESECDGIVEEPDYIQLGEVIEQMEIDNGWHNGMCEACYEQHERSEALYEKAHMEYKMMREECVR